MFTTTGGNGDVLAEVLNLKPKKESVEVSPGIVVEVVPCLPTVSALTQKGMLKITMTKDIEPLTPNDLKAIHDSNIVQMQVIPNSPGSAKSGEKGELNFNWWV